MNQQERNMIGPDVANIIMDYVSQLRYDELTTKINEEIIRNRIELQQGVFHRWLFWFGFDGGEDVMFPVVYREFQRGFFLEDMYDYPHNQL